jgi:Nodulation protein S (NodS)
VQQVRLQIAALNWSAHGPHVDIANPVRGSAELPTDRQHRPVTSANIRELARLLIPKARSRVRLELHYCGRKLGKVDLIRPPGIVWADLAERWVREETLPRLLPRLLLRHAWRDRRLLGRILRLGTDRRSRHFLWDLLHAPVSTWRRSLAAFVVNRQETILGYADTTTDKSVDARRTWDRAKWEGLFAVPDPWGYSSPYEQTKYEHTLELLPEGPIGRALELACAEGHFTVQLAPRVGSLVAGIYIADELARLVCDSRLGPDLRRVIKPRGCMVVHARRPHPSTVRAILRQEPEWMAGWRLRKAVVAAKAVQPASADLRWTDATVDALMLHLEPAREPDGDSRPEIHFGNLDHWPGFVPARC